MSYRYPPSYQAALRRARRASRYRRYRYYSRRMPGWQKAAVVAVTAGALAGAGKAAVHHHHRHGLPAAAAPVAVSGDLSSRLSWARSFLRAIPEPRTPCNLSAVVAWETREGGGFGNQAAFNPLNVNPGPGTPWPGYSAIGAWAFPDPATGLAYSVRTILNGNYGGILSALAAGNSAQAVCNQIMASPWAASHYDGTLSATC